MTREHYPDDEIWANDAAEIDAPDTDLYAEAYESGPGKIPPRAGVHNKLFNRDNNMLQHIEQNGIPRWDARTSYPIGGHALGSDGVIYRSLTADNTNNNPTTDSVNWSRIVGELPEPTTGDEAKIPRVNAAEDGYELVGRASEAEAIAGTDGDKYMTPATTEAALSKDVISTIELSGASFPVANLASLFSDNPSYEYFEIEGIGITVATDNATVLIGVSTNGSSADTGASARQTYLDRESGSASSETTSSSGSAIELQALSTVGTVVDFSLKVRPNHIAGGDNQCLIYGRSIRGSVSGAGGAITRDHTADIDSGASASTGLVLTRLGGSGTSLISGKIIVRGVA